MKEHDNLSKIMKVTWHLRLDVYTCALNIDLPVKRTVVYGRDTLFNQLWLTALVTTKAIKREVPS